MKKPNQLQLFKRELRFFGGALLHGKRRSQRPLSSKEPIHLVMRSSWAMGSNSFLSPRNKNEIKRLIRITSDKYFVKVYQLAIASNHCHLVIKIPDRRRYKTFIRVLSSLIASHVMREQSFKVFRKSILNTLAGDPPAQAPKGVTEQQGKDQGFWQFRPWTRVLSWGRDYKTCCEYVRQNTLEALGFAEHKPRKSYYQKWLGSIFDKPSGKG